MNPKAHELVEQLRRESTDVVPNNASLYLVRKQMTIFAELLVLLAIEAEQQSHRLDGQMTELVGVAKAQQQLAAKLDGQTDTLIQLTRSLRKLTVGLFILTVGLILFEGAHFLERLQPIAQSSRQRLPDQEHRPVDGTAPFENIQYPRAGDGHQ